MPHIECIRIGQHEGARKEEWWVNAYSRFEPSFGSFSGKISIDGLLNGENCLFNSRRQAIAVVKKLFKPCQNRGKCPYGSIFNGTMEVFKVNKEVEYALQR